jgi:hypothetical protein
LTTDFDPDLPWVAVKLDHGAGCKGKG